MKNEKFKTGMLIIAIVVAVAVIVISNILGNTYAASVDDYSCSSNYSVVTDGNGKYYCCPSGYQINTSNVSGSDELACIKQITATFTPFNCDDQGGTVKEIDRNSDGNPQNFCVLSSKSAVKKATYTVYFYNGDTKVDQKSCTTNNGETKCSVSVPSEIPTKEGHTYVGWSKNCEKNQIFKKAFNVSSTNNGTKYYACFEENESYVVKYDLNGGIGTFTDQSKVQGVALTLSTVIPTKEGSTFVSWNDKQDGTGNSYAAGATYNADQAVTLYAMWEEVKGVEPTTYSVKYDLNGGTGTFADQTKEEGKALALNAGIPTKEGYTFVSWNDKQDGTGTSYAAGATYNEDKDITLYAKWEMEVITEEPDDDEKQPGDDSGTTGDKTDEEIDTNNQTGDALIYTAWIVGMGALGYVVYYYSKRKNEI